MKFIKVTEIVRGGTGICYIAVDKIIRIMGANSGALIDMRDKVDIFTEESPERILELIEKVGADDEH